MHASLSDCTRFSFRRFSKLFGGTLEAFIAPVCIVHVLLDFEDGDETMDKLLMFTAYLLLLFLVVQLARLFVDRRAALFGIGRALLYLIATSVGSFTL